MKIIQEIYPLAGTLTPRSVSMITDFIIHHTAGPINQTALDICKEHMDRGFSTIGYNWVITEDGVVHSGRQIEYVPAAAYGRNTQSVNVALTGNFEFGDPGYTGPPTPQQIQALKDLCVYAHASMPNIVRTIGHKDVAPLFFPSDEADYSTACPGSQLYSLIPAVKQYVREKLHQAV